MLVLIFMSHPILLRQLEECEFATKSILRCCVTFQGAEYDQQQRERMGINCSWIVISMKNDWKLIFAFEN